SAFAQSAPETNTSNSHAKKFYMRGYAKPSGGGGSNLNYHNGGTVIRNANVVMIFWGPTFNQAGSADNAYAQELQSFRNQFGTTPEYNTITQYYGEDPVSGYGNIAQGSLVNQADWFDTSTPPQNVTDATVQSEVQRYVAAHGVDYNTVYEVYLPKTSFSSDGSQASCGATSGFSLAYCAYHSHYVDGSGKNVKYSIEPYPGCSGCQVSGFTAAQNQEHFATHETREAVTDALGNAWFDRRGYEADDKCAWSPTPFIGTGGYAYQYEWSNANGGCVKTK
ncbi:MAG: hypothetical protein WBX15_11630, partial [Thermoanaerobaculia bacterium]